MVNFLYMKDNKYGMKPKERIIQLLAAYPKKPWMQKELAERAGCSRPYVSKLVKGFEKEGIIAKPYKNQLRLINPEKLLVKWAAIRKMPKPEYITATTDRAEAVLGKMNGYAVTFLRAAWHRTHFMKAERIDIYADDKFRVEKIGSASKVPTPVAVYREPEALEGRVKVGGLWLVSPALNYVDLVVKGHAQAAGVLAEKEGL